MTNYEYQIVCHIVAARAVKVAATANFIAQDLALALYIPRHKDGALRSKLDRDGLAKRRLPSVMLRADAAVYSTRDRSVFMDICWMIPTAQILFILR